MNAHNHEPRVPTPIPHYSLGQHLGKHTRHQLVHLCITHITREIMDKPLSNNKPGRPPTPETTLAATINVSPKTVKRWTSHPDAIQSCDTNANKLAEAAYTYNPHRTTETLLEDVASHQRIVKEWLTRRTNTLTSPCPTKQTTPGDLPK